MLIQAYVSHLPLVQRLLTRGAISGDSEVLRDEITLLAHKASMAGARVKHEMYVDQVHVFQSFPFLEAAHTAFRSIAKFTATVQDTAQRQPIAPTERPISPVPSRLAESLSSRSSTPADIDTVASEMEHGPTRLVKGDGTEIDIAAVEETSAEDGQVPLPNAPSTVNETSPTLPAPKPILRRAFSSFSRSSTPPSTATPVLHHKDGSHTTGHSPVDCKTLDNKGASTLPLNRRRRRPTLSAQLTLSPAKPTTRLRANSHADMIQLMSTYSAGAANQTTVYTPAHESNPFDHSLIASVDNDGSSSYLDTRK